MINRCICRQQQSLTEDSAVKMAARTGAQKLSLLRRGWNEVPDLVCSLTLGGLGVLLAGVALYKNYRAGARSQMHRLTYTVIRDTDVKDPKKLGDVYN